MNEPENPPAHPQATPPASSPPAPSESLYEAERRQKVQKLRELGVDPFGARTAGLAPLADIKALHRPDMGQDGGPVVKAAGRVMLKRDMGKLSFMTLRDETGDLQVALDKRRLDATAWEIRNLIDLGDQVTVEGPLGATKTGEVTVWATALGMASKSFLPPPSKEFATEGGETKGGFSDVEARYRQRYVDLWANPDVMRTMKLRIRVVEAVRAYLRDRGFLEVETPMLQPIHGGAAARPFVTHHNALDLRLFLRIAPELYLKRLLVGGFSKVFEINRNFRNEGISPRHNPEFTMLEAYEAYGNWETMADLVEGMVCHVAETVFGTLHIEHPNGRKINLTRPWRRVRLVDLVEERTGWKFDKRPIQDAAPEFYIFLDGGEFFGHIPAISDFKGDPAVLSHLQRSLAKMSPAEQLVEVYEKLIEPTLIDPCFTTHFPSVIIPLAKENREDSFFADVYELAINGYEVSPGYAELNDPDVQAKHFAHQVGDKEEQQKTDEDFLTALRYGMPPAGGMGLGIDRLVMMLTGAESIRDVILFPLMRPQG